MLFLECFAYKRKNDGSVASGAEKPSRNPVGAVGNNQIDFKKHWVRYMAFIGLPSAKKLQSLRVLLQGKKQDLWRRKSDSWVKCFAFG